MLRKVPPTYLTLPTTNPPAGFLGRRGQERGFVLVLVLLLLLLLLAALHCACWTGLAWLRKAGWLAGRPLAEGSSTRTRTWKELDSSRSEVEEKAGTTLGGTCVYGYLLLLRKVPIPS